MSHTPRTDAVAKTLADFWDTGVLNTAEVVPADFARKLERELRNLRECLVEANGYDEDQVNIVANR